VGKFKTAAQLYRNGRYGEKKYSFQRIDYTETDVSEKNSIVFKGTAIPKRSFQKETV
jgi:hypothetical protein